MKRILALISFLFLFSIPGGVIFSLSTSLEEISVTRIYFGLKQDQIMNEQGGGEDWKPLFFSVDDGGDFHIPDFYKQRIAVFDRKGSLKKAIPCESGISPRMNFFALTEKGSYVTYNDGSLYVISRTGTLSWKYNFGIGIIPERIFPADTALFIVLSGAADSDGRAIVFDYFSATPVGRFGTKKDNRGLPLIQGTAGIPFTLNLADMQLVAKSKTGFSSGDAGINKNINLLFISSTGESIWKQSIDSGEIIYCFSKEGVLSHKGSVYYPSDPASASGTGFWTVADKNRVIFKNYFYKDYMEIAEYAFK